MKQSDYEISSGNLYADLNYPNPKELQAKSELAREIYLIIQSKGMKQKGVGELFGISQPKVSNLLNGRLSGFSLERLTRSEAKKSSGAYLYFFESFLCYSACCKK